MQKSGILYCNFKHGGKGTKLYEVWCSMRRRCNSPKDKRYKSYGGKGVFVCKEWEDFKNFKDRRCGKTVARMVGFCWNKA